MRKSLACLWAAVLVLLLLSGCSGSGGRTTGSATYYNGYLGLRVSVPVGVYMERNTANLTETPEESQDFFSLEWSDGIQVNFLDLQTSTDSANDSHAELTLFAEDFSDYKNFNSYLNDFEYLIGRDYEDYSCDLMDVSTAYLAGQEFLRFEVCADAVDGDYYFIEEYYVAQVGYLSFVVYINYWPNQESQSAAYDLLECFDLEGGMTGSLQTI